MSGLTTTNFYGSHKHNSEITSPSLSTLNKVRREQCHFLNIKRLQGPPIGWKVFPRLHEAIKYASIKANGCMTFTYEQSTGQRAFMVAHPETFWYYDSIRPYNKRHTYEIITENHPCKLYFDIEFEYKENLNSNGIQMLETFVKIIKLFIKQKFDLECSERDILDLDSSTVDKFSHHLIFPNIVFSNNIQAGYFVKFICGEIKKMFLEDLNSDDQNYFHDGITINDLFNLKTNKGLFCDECVYTRNRNFRIYKSSKLNKNVPLVLSKTNKYELPEKAHCTDCFDKHIFLKSLVTYGCDKKLLLNFTNTCSEIYQEKFNVCFNKEDQSECHSSYSQSPYPKIDKFISNLIFPGKIFRYHYFPSANKLVYSIIKNRYCGNVKRQHKSNNVKYIVDLNEMFWYQKCYDPDCEGYKSNGTKLPDEIYFEYAKTSIDNLSDSKLLEVANTVFINE